ncbi:MAG: hypothetical protein QF637_09720 [Acidimicrobiales bacterium]|nr:hypothetical protein [Acidimicrobiales bacterium]
MTTNGNEGRLLEEAQRIVDRAYQRIKVDRQYRRLCNAFGKLGITQIVGKSWCFIDEDSLQISFGALPEHRRSLFIEHLVDVAEEVESRVTDRVLVGAPGSHPEEQLQLDLGLDFSEGTDTQAGGRS